MNQDSSSQVAAARKVWRIQPPLPAEARSSLGKANYHPLLARLLYNREIADAHQAQAFLSTEPISHDPLTLTGIEAAIHRLRRALEHRERIAVFGDFDVDGVTATALLARALKPLGTEILPYIPHRVEEGHGLSLQAIHALARQNVDLLITVDCGITSYIEIDAAARAGIDTIVTDHHLAPEGPPRACAVVDPRLPGSRYPFPYLTGAGLALKLVQALYHSMRRNDAPWQSLLPLAALGTVADMAPLVDENRSIVRQGLQELGRTTTPGLRTLMRSAHLEGRVPDTEAISWVLAPRLNAAGRMDHASISYELLVTESEERATALAATLEQQNRERQRITAEAQEKARTLIELKPLLMVSDPSFSPGIVGLVAGKLVEEFCRPAVVVSLEEEVSRGSCRSIPEFDIGSALHRVAPSIGGFVRHGGHPRAAGFIIATEKLPALRRELVALAQESLGEEAFQPRLDIDLELPLGTLPRDIYRIIEGLAPFGAGNPAPVFLSRNVQLAGMRPLGSNGEHLRLKLRDQGVTWDAIAFRLGAHLPAGADSLDVVYTVDIDYWGGEETLRLNVMDLRAAE
ncbi:single-stranded-DNA-specific exonuclease RecJ [Chloroflexota bacterium]